jgi:hypothetical protein
MSTKTRIDKILMKHHVDQTAQFGGCLEGNGCHKLAEATWETIKSNQEVRILDPKEQAKAVGRKEMMKSKNVRSDQTEARRAAKHQKRIEARKESMACPVICTNMLKFLYVYPSIL